MERRLCDTTRASFAVNLIIIIFSTCESAIDFIQWYCGYSSSDRKRSCYENTHRTERWRMKNITTRQFSILGDCGKIYQFMLDIYERDAGRRKQGAVHYTKKIKS